MNWLRFSMVCLGMALAGFTAEADISAPSSLIPQSANLSAANSIIPPLPQTLSPVGLFRRLLNMSARERDGYLTNRPPQVREALRVKISEYLAMDPDARELRLRATELRWQLIPLLQMAPADRTARLTVVPADLAPLVKSRLEEWDRLPAALQQEFLANDRTLHYFAHVEATNQVAEADREQRETIASQFNQFFELTPDEKQRTLKTLSGIERAQMEHTLQAYAKLPPQQRFECLRAFGKFAQLPPAERKEFLKNAERWAEMSPQERQTWRDLVAKVPAWPPLPANIFPPLPPPLKVHPAMFTNRN
jgi:hypothetical protein